VAASGAIPSFFARGTKGRLDSRSFVEQKRLNLAINKVWVLGDRGIFKDPPAPAPKPLALIAGQRLRKDNDIHRIKY
jgi:hypothetical protein